MTTRERALAAAVSVVATFGFQALTHARVDATAKLPPGSTSNYFRTKEALVTGLIDYISDQEKKNTHGAFEPETPEEMIDRLSRLIIALTTERLDLTTARLAIFLSGTHAASIRASFESGANGFYLALVESFKKFGAKDPVTAARAVMAVSEGIIMHRIAWEADSDPRPQMALVVNGALAPS